VALVAQLRRQDLGALRVRAHAVWELMQADRRPRPAQEVTDAEPVVVFPDAALVGAGRRQSLCTVCALAAVDAHDEWTWLACETCLVVDWAGARLLGAERLLPLGRHPLMNAVAAAPAASARLDRWRAEEARRVAAKAGLDGSGRVPLARWPAPPGEPLVTSADAFARLLTRELPELVASEPRLAQPAALQAAVARGNC
jgi:hypothetical protein